MEMKKQIQSAGDNVQQIQADTIIIQNGITEERVREIYSEMSMRAIQENTVQAEVKAIERIDLLESTLIPRIKKVDAAFECFSEPAFQVLLKKAQLAAICSDRDDYSILSELLVHRIMNKSNIKKKASITKAVEIVDQIDDDSLCALTVFLAVSHFIPLSGYISEGITALSDLYNKLDTNSLPEDSLWIDNLLILGAITTTPFSRLNKYDELLSRALPGYVCAGIKQGSEEYEEAIKKLAECGISRKILVENELLNEYVRLCIRNEDQIEDLVFIRSEVGSDGTLCSTETPFNDKQKECIKSVLGLYSQDTAIIEQVKQNFKSLLNSYPSIAKVISWWDSLKIFIALTSVGRAIAHANAKRIDNSLPDLD